MYQIKSYITRRVKHILFKKAERQMDYDLHKTTLQDKPHGRGFLWSGSEHESTIQD